MPKSVLNPRNKNKKQVGLEASIVNTGKYAGARVVVPTEAQTGEVIWSYDPTSGRLNNV